MGSLSGELFILSALVTLSNSNQQVADSCAVNLKAAQLLGLPHVNCHNHLLNAEVNQWIKEYATIKKTVETAQNEMKVARGSLKNQAVLRKLTNLTVEVGNDTKWTSWGTMMAKHHRMKDILWE